MVTEMNLGDRILHSRLDAQEQKSRLGWLRHIVLCLNIKRGKFGPMDVENRNHMQIEIDAAKLALMGLSSTHQATRRLQ